MEKPWPYFWFTLAAIFCCALLAAVFSRGSSVINIGSVADWFSGSMAAVAAATALYIANRDAKRASDLRAQNQLDQAAAARAGDLRRLKVVMALLDNGIGAADHIYRMISEQGDAKGWSTTFVTSGNARATTDALAEIGVDTFNDTYFGLTLITVRRMWALEVAAIQTMANGEVPGPEHLNTDNLKEMVRSIADTIVQRDGGPAEWDSDRVTNLINEAKKRREAEDMSVHAAA